MKKIQKKIDIKASKEKVWDVLTKDQYTRKWYAEFSEGSHAETDWSVGSKAVFKDKSQSGMVAKVTENRPCEYLAISFEGLVSQGKEDYDSAIAQEFKGGIESYKLFQNDGTTNLMIESDITEDMYDSMSETWEKALAKLKSVAEAI